MKLVFIITCLFYRCQCGTESDFEKIDSLKQEMPCSYNGGNCVFASDCPSELLAEPGLCPEQQPSGVECCYGLSIKETRCEKHGGMCIPMNRFCGQAITYREATNCESDQKCCILV